MVTVEDLRNELIGLGLSIEEAEGIKGKTNLQNRISELRVDSESSDILNEAEIVDDEANLSKQLDFTMNGKEIVAATTENSIERTSPDWPDFVLSHLEEHEKIKGHPKGDSLRRLTELLVGRVVGIETEVPQCPSMENGDRATVIVKVTIDCYDGSVEVATGAADVCPRNTEQLFAKFPVATAESRAEGRAYRKVLRLINVMVAEELVDESQIFDPTDKISFDQITFIDTLCSPAKNNINVVKFLAKYEIDSNNLESVSKSKAMELCKVLSSFESTSVPEELIGYQTNWR
jgi:hypothetical protein